VWPSASRVVDVVVMLRAVRVEAGSASTTRSSSQTSDRGIRYGCAAPLSS